MLKFKQRTEVCFVYQEEYTHIDTQSRRKKSLEDSAKNPFPGPCYYGSSRKVRRGGHAIASDTLGPLGSERSLGIPKPGS